MDKVLKVGVIGAGGIANSVHFPSLREIADTGAIELCAVADTHPEKLARAQEKCGFARTYSLHRDMLEAEELDAVLVLVQCDKMYRVAHDVIQAGIHCLLEKPAGITAYQAHSLARQAAEKGIVCAAAMNRRAVPLVQYVLKRMRELTEFTQVDGLFIKYSDVAAGWHYASSFVCDIVHAVDLVRYLAGSEPEKAATVIAAHNSPVDNAWSSVIRFKNGITGTLRSNYQSAGRVHDFTIHGPGATAFINLGFGTAACEATIMHGNGITQYSIGAAGVVGPGIEKIDGLVIAGSDNYHQYYGYKPEEEDFFNAIRTGAKPICPIDDAAKTMDMVELLLNSAI
ncbi:MAG: Gfo/Idh/MocA family oxidoreductase [Ruminococcaceae bacterium]|nr:Gfo/Idh/MocA family oxidoreductase [Oscillospiraceae bacterium]